MILALLFACYDKLVVTATVDVVADRVRGESRLYNLWRGSVVCTDTPSCRDALVQEVRQQEATLREAGAIEVAGGLVLRDGEVDLRMRWVFPLADRVFANQSFLLLYEQPARGLVARDRRRPRAALVWFEDDSTRITVDRAPPAARVWTLPDAPTRQGLLLPGKRSSLQVSFQNLSPVKEPAHEAAWIPRFMSLDEALRAVPGLVWADDQPSPTPKMR
ncbi:MAG: hypothetical protein EXR71_18810 [Myxococcales bacterium]|nr:hypothetical protein [Myxococcales bacterium]